MARSDSFQAQKEDLLKIKKSRSKTGCGCKPSNGVCCNTKKCICRKEGLECHEDSCSCTDENCKNPQRHTFDEEKILKFVQTRLKQLNSPRQLKART